MARVTVPGFIDEHGNIFAELPADAPTGQVELTIQQLPGKRPSAQQASDHERAALRFRLRSANLLSTASFASEDAVALSHEERVRAGELPAGARPSEDLIAEDRDRA